MRIKGDFGQLDGMVEQIQATVGRVQDEMDAWTRMAGATSEDWLDRAGGEFGEVSAAWAQVSQAQNEMLSALRDGVRVTTEEFRQALAAAQARVASTTL
jgi:uncharacterized protein YukE